MHKQIEELHMSGCALGAYVDDCKYRHIAGHVYYTGVPKYSTYLLHGAESFLRS